MKKHMIIGIVILAIIVMIPALAYAKFVTLTSSFGGKVITPNLPLGTCTGFGTGPVVLASSIESLGSAVVSSTGIGGQSTPTRVSGTISGLYGAIPFYAKIGIPSTVVGGFNFVGAVPKVGDWILGRANVIPDFSTCIVTGTGETGSTGIPFPVRDTSDYKVSSSSGGL